MRKKKSLMAAAILLCFTAANAQVSSLIKPKNSLWVPKIDLYWSTIVIADNFPTFFPLELEFSIPSARLSFGAITSPWHRRFNTQTTQNRETTVIAGLYMRYYFPLQRLAEAATGIFIEPQIFYRHQKKFTDPVIAPTVTTSRSDLAVMAAVGYQHVFFDFLYLQLRVSVGYAPEPPGFLSSYRVGDLVILPWFGLGIGLN